MSFRLGQVLILFFFWGGGLFFQLQKVKPGHRSNVLLLAALGNLAGGCAASPAAWRSDLIAGRPVAGVQAGSGRDGFSAIKSRINALQDAKAVQGVTHEYYWAKASGFVEGDLQDVEWFYNEAAIRGIIAVPRIPGGVDGWEAESKALGLPVTGFYGVSERSAPKEPFTLEQIYSTTVPDVFLQITDGHVVAIIRVLKPVSRPSPKGDRSSIFWLSGWHDKPELGLHSWTTIRNDLEKFNDQTAAGFIENRKLKEVVTPDVREFIQKRLATVVPP